MRTCGFLQESPSTKMDADSVQQKLEDQITCPVCLEIFREPKVLSCYHVFCLPCLESARRKVKSGDQLLCPQCRAPVDIPPQKGLSALQTAFHINSLIEIYDLIQIKSKSPSATAAPVCTCANCGPESEARYFCPQCSGFLCEDCRVIHGKWPKYSQHTPSTISGEGSPKNGELSCTRHPSQPPIYYCQRCASLVCSECLDESADRCSHAEEHVVSVTEAMHQSKDAILSTLEPVRRHLGSIEGVIERIRAKKRHVAEQATNVVSCIDTDFCSLRRALEQRQTALKEAAEREEEGKLVGLKSQEDRAEAARVQLSDYLEGINNCLQKGGSLQVIKMKQVVRERVSVIMQEFQDLPLSPVEEANLHYFSCRDLSTSLPSHGVVYSSSVAAADFSMALKSRHWATACTESSVAVVHLGHSRLGDSYSQLDLSLTSEDNTNTIVMRRREFYLSNKQVAIYYIPISKGKKKLHVTLFGSEISGSPVDLTVMAPLRFTGTFVHGVGELKRPWGVAVTRTGQLVIIDNNGWAGVHVFEANGTKVRSFVRVALVTPELLLPKQVCSEPRGVAISKDGKILLVDGKRHRVQCLSFDGTLISVVGSHGKEPLQFNDPVGITVAPCGEVLVCDRRNHRIQVLGPTDFGFVRQIGKFDGDRPESLYLPWDIACDSEGLVYVADCGHCCVKVFTMEGRFVKKIGSEGIGRGQFKHLSSVAIDCNDYLYALDTMRACVSVFNPRGEFKMQFGTHGELEAQFYKPHGITVDSKGQVYVTDGETSTIVAHPSGFRGRVQVFQ